MSIKRFITKSAKSTKEIAAKFAEQILRQKPGKTAIILGLQGELGSGKTTFLQGFAKGLGIKEKILSPTFIIMKKFKIPQVKILNTLKLTYSKISRPRYFGYRLFYHIDCYRLNKPEEILSLGFKRIISDPQNIVAIEWPEKIKSLLPNPSDREKLTTGQGNKISIKFNHINKTTRKLTIKK